MRKGKIFLSLLVFAAILMAASVSALVGAPVCPIFNSTNMTSSTRGDVIAGTIFRDNIFTGATYKSTRNSANTLQGTMYVLNTTNNQWMENVSLAYQLGELTGALASVSSAFNLTNTNRTDIVIMNGAGALGFGYWNGSNVTNNTNVLIKSIGALADNSENLMLIPGFPSPPNFSMFYVNATSGGGFNASSCTITVCNENDNILRGLPRVTGGAGYTAVYNFSGSNNWEILLQYGSASLLNIFSWNGTFWNNMTTNRYTLPTGPGEGKFAVVYNTTNSLNNYTIFSWAGSVDTPFFSGYGNVSGLSTTSPSFNATLNYGDYANFTTGLVSGCEVLNTTISTNYTGTYDTIINASGYARINLLNISANLSFLSKCDTIIGFNVTVGDAAGRVYSFLSASAPVFPYIYNLSAEATATRKSTCTSRNNMTITSNTTNIIDILVNMSKIVVGGNSTCFYKASRVDRIRNVNKSSNCDVWLINANITAGTNSTVEPAGEVEVGFPANIGIAIGVAAVAAIVISYAIVRRRRAAE